MKRLLFALSLALGCFACSEEEIVVDPYANPFGINYSDYANASNANGSIRYQDYGGAFMDLTIDSAYITKPDANGIFMFMYKFTGLDSLKLFLKKSTSDYNYHSEALTGSNKILKAIFNNDTLLLNPSAESIQPRTETNSFHTVLNLHTSNGKGNFNGTVDSVISIDSIFVIK